MANVLSGGYKLTFHMASPKWFYEEFYLIRQRGLAYDERHVCVQTCSRQVIQPVNGNSNHLLLTSISTNLEFYNFHFSVLREIVLLVGVTGPPMGWKGLKDTSLSRKASPSGL